MATALLIDILGQALGPQPTGVVNFNQLHRLLLEIIGYLGQLDAEKEVSEIAPLKGIDEPNVFDTTGKSVDAKDGLVDDVKLKSEGKERGDTSGDEEVWPIVTKTDSALDTRVRRVASNRSLAAINELGVLENRLNRLETRLDAAESIPEVMMKRASEGHKPVNEIWHYTTLEKRMDAAEQSLDRVTMTLLITVCRLFLFFFFLLLSFYVSRVASWMSCCPA